MSNHLAQRIEARSFLNRAYGRDKLSHITSGQFVRSIAEAGQTFYSLVDLINILTDTTDEPRKYWSDNKRLILAKDSELCASIVQLKITAADGKKRLTDCAPLWGCASIILLIDTPLANKFENRLAKLTIAEIKYRMGNVARGLEWNADLIHKSFIETDVTVKPISIDTAEWQTLRITDEKKEKNSMSEEVVYLITFTETPGYYKIGRTTNLACRLKTLEWASPFKVIVEHTIATADSATLEASLHRRFNVQRVKLEWFKLSPQDVAEIKAINPIAPDMVQQFEAHCIAELKAAKAYLLKWAMVQTTPVEMEEHPRLCTEYNRRAAFWRAISPEDALREFVDNYVFSSMSMNKPHDMAVVEMVDFIQPIFDDTPFFWAHVETLINEAVQKARNWAKSLDARPV
jgi:Meiotically up-regulated gene 113